MWNPFKRAKVETREEDISWKALAALSPAGVAVNARLAENLSTILACVCAISTAIASLPAWVYRLSESGRDVDTLHPLARLVRNGPNRHQTWPDFIEWLMASVLLQGNALAEIVTDARGVVVALVPIPWSNVNVLLLPSGRVAFDVTEMTAIGGTGRTRRLLEDEALWLRDRSDDGLLGRSRLQRAAPAVTTAMSLQDFAGSMMKNGINPSGAVQTDQVLTDDQYDDLLKRLAEFSGSNHAAKALILHAGLKWEQISVSPEDAELLASRRFSVEELSRIYGCPPPIIGDLSNGTFTNSETVGRWFAQFTLSAWIKKIECEIHRSVFSAASRQTHEFEIDLSGFMRGDPESRWKSHEIAVKNKILVPNEIRRTEGWNARAGGDDFGEEPQEAQS